MAGNDSNSDEEDGGKVAVLEMGDSPSNVEIDTEIELLKLANALRRAAQACRVRYRCPQVRFVLPRIVPGRTPAIDEILARIRATGAVVDCGHSSSGLSQDSLSSSILSMSLESTFSLLLPSPHPDLTQTLNIDCTVLLALVSDLSHLDMYTEPHLHTAINHQILSELSDRLLSSSLYPALKGRSLVCSQLAFDRMYQIVHTMGTSTERLRTDILMGNKTSPDKSSVELRNELAAHSMHQVPPDLLLPISVVPDFGHVRQLPSVVVKLEPLLSEINKAVFFLGWERGWTTITSNRTVARLIEETIKSECVGMEGPKVWICRARSLIGKENRKKKHDSKETREHQAVGSHPYHVTPYTQPSK